MPSDGEVSEWSIETVSKTVDSSRGPRVRIPPSPCKKKGFLLGAFFFVSQIGNLGLSIIWIPKMGCIPLFMRVVARKIFHNKRSTVILERSDRISHAESELGTGSITPFGRSRMTVDTNALLSSWRELRDRIGSISKETQKMNSITPFDLSRMTADVDSIGFQPPE